MSRRGRYLFSTKLLSSMFAKRKKEHSERDQERSWLKKTGVEQRRALRSSSKRAHESRGRRIGRATPSLVRRSARYDRNDRASVGRIGMESLSMPLGLLVLRGS